MNCPQCNQVMREVTTKFGERFRCDDCNKWIPKRKGGNQPNFNFSKGNGNGNKDPLDTRLNTIIMSVAPLAYKEAEDKKMDSKWGHVTNVIKFVYDSVDKIKNGGYEFVKTNSKSKT